MTLPRTGKRALAGFCALTLLFAACGDDEDSSDESPDTEETTTTEGSDETTESEPEEGTTGSEPEEEAPEGEGEGDPEAVATAEAINLKIDDFAAGWVEEPDDGEDDGADIDDCFVDNDIAGTTVGEAETPTFTLEAQGQTAQSVSMQTVVFDSPESATAILEEVSGEAFAGCAQEQLLADAPEGTTAALVPTVDEPPLTEESVGVAGAVQIVAEDGSTGEGLIDLHVFRTGEVVSFSATIDFVGDEAFASTLDELYRVIAERHTTELG